MTSPQKLLEQAEGEERNRLWRRITTWMPTYAWYQRRTERRIPVAVLERI